jgi:DNA-binding FrmR family transcriptional regulator
MPSLARPTITLDGALVAPYTLPGILSGIFSMSHTITKKTKLLNRVRRVRGQIEALERAVMGEEGCAAVLHLIVAARGGINGLMAEVIEDHIRMHVVDPAKDTERRRGAEELIEAVQSYLK